jgi:hypothetical protein
VDAEPLLPDLGEAIIRQASLPGARGPSGDYVFGLPVIDDGCEGVPNSVLRGVPVDDFAGSSVNLEDTGVRDHLGWADLGCK